MLNPKKYLKQLKCLKNIIESKKEQLKNLRLLATGMVGIDYGKEIMGLSNNSDKIGSMVARIMDTENEINEDILKYTNMYNEINCKIQLIPDIELQTVLIDKYINFMTFERIAEKNGCSIRWIYELHQRGLSAFSNLYEKSHFTSFLCSMDV